MTPEEIKRARAIIDASTPGPWTVEDHYGPSVHSEHSEMPGSCIAEEFGCLADATLVAESRTGWGKALDAFEAIDEENRNLWRTNTKYLGELNQLRTELDSVKNALDQAQSDSSSFQEGSSEWEQEAIDAKKERDQLLSELNEYKYLHRQCVSLVMPGEVDSSDAYMKILRDLRTELSATKALCERYREALENCKERISSDLEDHFSRMGKEYLSGKYIQSDSLLKIIEEVLAAGKKDKP